jgi:glutamyl-tRNA reductase
VLNGAHKAQLARTSGLLMVDAGMPRNIDPALKAALCGGRLVNLEDLKRWCGVRAGGVEEALLAGRGIVEVEKEAYGKILQSL